MGSKMSLTSPHTDAKKSWIRSASHTPLLYHDYASHCQLPETLNLLSQFRNTNCFEVAYIYDSYFQDFEVSLGGLNNDRKKKISATDN